MINITLQKGYLKIHGIPGKGRGKVITEEKQMMIIQENYFIWLWWWKREMIMITWWRMDDYNDDVRVVSSRERWKSNGCPVISRKQKEENIDWEVGEKGLRMKESNEWKLMNWFWRMIWREREWIGRIIWIVLWYPCQSDMREGGRERRGDHHQQQGI